jgi:glycosyltransferase involved in cell wall biosynthesis
MNEIDTTRTLFVGIGKSAPCWYRCALPAMFIGAEWCGVRGPVSHMEFVTGLSTRALEVEEFFDYQTVVLQQVRGGEWLGLIRRLQAAGVNVLYEIDDDVHAVRKHDSHAHKQGFSKAILRDLELAMRACDGVIVSTPFLAQRYRSLNGNIAVCRNGLDLGRYDLTPPRGGEQVTIGWAGGVGHQEALMPWLKAVERVLEQRPHARFMSVGEPYAQFLEGRFGAERAIALPWLDIDTYPAAMSNFDIAIAPAGRSNFYKAKSDLRWLEAGALGVPAVADPDVYPEIEHGVTGLHAEDLETVERQLLALVDDASLRRRIGESAREHVHTHRSMAVMARQWAEAIPALAAAAHERAAA